MLDDKLIDMYKKLKEEEFNYIGDILEIRNKRIFTEYEKLEIYRSIIKYQKEENKLFYKLKNHINTMLNREKSSDINPDTVIFEIEINKKIISLIDKYDSPLKEELLKELGINPDNNKYQITFANFHLIHDRLGLKNIDIIINQPFFDKPFYCYSDIKFINNCYETTSLYDEVGECMHYIMICLVIINYYMGKI